MSLISINEWYDLIGSTWLRDSICLFLTTPFSLLGLGCNLLCLIILNRKKFNKLPIYLYIKYAVMNGILVNFLSFFLFLTTCYRFMEFTYLNTSASIYISFIYVPIMNFCVLFGSCLEICSTFITLEKSYQLLPKLSEVFKRSFKKISLVLGIACVLINIQYFFIVQPTFMDVKIESNKENTTLRAYSFQITEFSHGLAGIVINYTTYFLRDIVLLILQIFLCMFSIHLLKRRLKKDYKTFLMLNTISFFKKDKQKLHTENSKNFPVFAFKFQQGLSKSDRNMILALILITVFTTVEHVLLIITNIYFGFIMSNASFLIFSISSFWITLKHSLYFVVLFSFSKMFRFELKKHLGLRSHKVTFNLSNEKQWPTEYVIY